MLLDAYTYTDAWSELELFQLTAEDGPIIEQINEKGWYGSEARAFSNRGRTIIVPEGTWEEVPNDAVRYLSLALVEGAFA